MLAMNLIGAPTSCRRFVSIFCAFVMMTMMTTLVESVFPSERDATSTLQEVKCVGLVINKKDSSKCQGTFLTQKHLATSCRCIGTTNNNTGVYTKGTPSTYEVRSWSKGPNENQAVSKLYFYYNCGIEPNKILLDLGLVETSSAFSTASVVPAQLPDAQLFRFYEYIYRLQILETRCLTTNLDKPAGSLLNVTVKPGVNCPRQQHCIGTKRTNCEMLVLQTNHICAVTKKEVNPTTSTAKPASNATTPSGGVTRPTPVPTFQKCAASAGAPLLCHKMLVGINGRSANCNDPINSHMFIRMDYTMDWLKSNICS